MITSTARRRRGLGVVPISDAAGNPVTPWSSTPAVITTPANGGSGCTTMDMLWGNITGDYSACVADNQAVIQAVADNAQMYYGGSVGQVTQDAATAQEAMVPSDVANVVATQPSLEWIWWALAGLAVFAVVELAK